jgi:hypothetical protein
MKKHSISYFREYPAPITILYDTTGEPSKAVQTSNPPRKNWYVYKYSNLSIASEE